MKIYLIVIVSTLIFSIFLSIAGFSLLTQRIYAQEDPCISAPPGAIPFAEGLVTGKSFNSSPQTLGPCLEGDQTNILLEQAKIRVDDYATLRSIFYDQSKAEKGSTIGTGRLPILSGSKIYSSNLNSDVRITGGPPSAPSSAVAVIFIDGNLDIGGDIIFRTDDPDSGIVFVVKDDINIDKNVNQIDAVLISSGTICTAALGGSPCFTSSYTITDPLVINGSLISLNPDEPIVFKRTLNDNSSNAAEKIYSQPKYLIILKGLLSKDLIAPF